MSDDDILIIIGNPASPSAIERHWNITREEAIRLFPEAAAVMIAFDDGEDRMVMREISAEELYMDRAEQLASITLARKERGPDPTEIDWPAFEKRPRQTWDNDPVRNRRARQGRRR